MNEYTEKRFAQVLKFMAKSYGVSVEKLTSNFAATVPMAQELNAAIQDSSDFLKAISIIPVTDSTGEVLDFATMGNIAGRTDLTQPNARRQPKMAGSPDGRKWLAKKTDYDVGIPYELLDQWARYKNFGKLFSQMVIRTMGLNRLTIGWYGQDCQAATDPIGNPNLEDVNFGWLYDLEQNKPEHFITEGATEDVIKLGGSGADFANLDYMVNSMKSLIAQKDRTKKEVAIIGEDLVSHDTGKVLELHAQTPSEKKVDIIKLEATYGGLPSLMVPGFPSKGVMIVDPKRLQIRYQLSGMRRKVADEPEYDRTASYTSMNEAYNIANLDGCVAIKSENVTLG